MKARFCVDFDGTLVEDDKYPEIGDWIPGAADAVRKLERIGQVVIFTCRVAPAHHETEEPRSPEAVEHELNAIRAKLREENLDHLEIWTRPFKPPAAAYIDNRGVGFRGDWDATIEDVLDLIAPVEDGGKTQGVLYSCACDQDDMCTRSCMKQDVTAPTRHPNSQRFHDLLAEAGALHDVKQADYGKGDDPFANVRSSADWNMPAWVGAMVRLNDKVKRLQKLSHGGDLMNESAIDSFMDIAVYALIARVLYEEQA